MDLKNAAAVCLISLFSATLVVLIARSLDNQTADRLEPQLAAIAEEIHALRSEGVRTGASDDSPAAATLKNGLIVYYFHGNLRCPTCRSIESQGHDVVQADFGPQLTDGTMLWKILNYEQPAVQSLATKFEVQMPVIVVAKMKDGQIERWKRLDEVWATVNDRAAFAKYVHDAIANLLGPNLATPSQKAPAIPIPN
jgi:hypothetical protein